jgi:ABC-type antimicrobial peptide transport system permease subunit
VIALIKRLRLQFLGRHETEIARGSLLIYSFSTGVENLRKRRLRSVLIIFSVIIMVAAIVGFTSLRSITMVLKIPMSKGIPIYNGIYIHYYQWGRGSEDIGETARDFLINYFKEHCNNTIIVPRCWKYTNYRQLIPSYVAPYAGLFQINCNNKTIYPRAFLGLTSQEIEVINISSMLVAGRWFEPSDRFSCILNEYQAEILNISLSNLTDKAQNIEIEGINFTVIGIVKNDFEYVSDLDGEPITPLKFDFPPGEPNPWNEHIRYWEFLIIDYHTLTSLGGKTVSLSIKIDNASELDLLSYASDLSNILSIFNLYISYGNNVFLYSSRNTMVIGGFQMQIIPMSIVILSVFNMLLGGVFERKREIYIYSAIGLSPRQISLLFFAETLVYALIGGIIGYLSGILLIRIGPIFLPHFQLQNFSSSIVLIGVGGSMIITILSSLYPSYISSKIVTPSLERVWKIPTKPQGDKWNIPFPFIAQSDLEKEGILLYLQEFLKSHMQREAPIFSISNLKRIDGTTIIGNRELPYNSLSMDCRLAPYEIGVMQKMDILAVKIAFNRWEFFVNIVRLSGGAQDWIRLNRIALTNLRQQFLIWRSLKPEEREKYISYQR